MIQIGPDMAEIQMVQARQAQQQAPAQGIASQWSAAQQGLPASPIGGGTSPSPIGGGLGGGMAALAAPSITRRQSPGVERSEDDDAFSWAGAGRGATQYGLAGASTGAQFGPYGALAGAAIGFVGGGIAGGLIDD